MAWRFSESQVSLDRYARNFVYSSRPCVSVKWANRGSIRYSMDCFFEIGSAVQRIKKFLCSPVIWWTIPPVLWVLWLVPLWGSLWQHNGAQSAIDKERFLHVCTMYHRRGLRVIVGMRACEQCGERFVFERTGSAEGFVLSLSQCDNPHEGLPRLIDTLHEINIWCE